MEGSYSPRNVEVSACGRERSSSPSPPAPPSAGMRRCGPSSSTSSPPSAWPTGWGTPLPACTDRPVVAVTAVRACFWMGGPAPGAPVKATGRLREKVISPCGTRRLSVTEIARILTADGAPVSAQTVWKICAAEGLPRLRGDDAASRGPATQLAPSGQPPCLAGPPSPWISRAIMPGCCCSPQAVEPELGLVEHNAGCGYSATRGLSAWQWVGTLLLATATRVPRAHPIDKITDNASLAFFLGLTALPRATHLSTYSYRARRESSQQLLTGLIRRLRPLGLASGEEKAGLRLHAIPPPRRRPGPGRALRARPVYSAPARCSPSPPATTPPARWSTPTPTSPRPSKPARSSPSPTTGTRPPGKTPPCWSLAPSSPPTRSSTSCPPAASPGSPCASAARPSSPASPPCPPARGSTPPPSSAQAATATPHLHEDMTTLKGISAPVRQIAIRNIGRNYAARLLITNGRATPARDLFARYAERMLIENELDAYISGFGLNALSSAVSLNVDLDTTLTVSHRQPLPAVRPQAATLRKRNPRTPSGGTSWTPPAPCTSPATPSPAPSTCAAAAPVLINAGFADLDVPIPWWNDGPCASASRPADFSRPTRSPATQPTGPAEPAQDLNRFSVPRIEASGRRARQARHRADRAAAGRHLRARPAPGKATPARTSPSITAPGPSPARKARRQQPGRRVPGARQGRDRGHLLRRRLRPLPGPRPVHHGPAAAAVAAAPRPGQSPRQPPGPRKPRSRFQADYARRAGVEGRRAPGHRPRRTPRPLPRPAPEPASTTCTWPAPSTFCRLEAYWTGTPLDRQRTSHLARLGSSASSHDPQN